MLPFKTLVFTQNSDVAFCPELTCITKMLLLINAYYFHCFATNKSNISLQVVYFRAIIMIDPSELTAFASHTWGWGKAIINYLHSNCTGLSQSLKLLGDGISIFMLFVVLC